jgi:hypothetical protein
MNNSYQEVAMSRNILCTCLAVIAGAAILTACAGGSPLQIAAYPAEPTTGPRAIAREPYPNGEVITTNADFELSVDDVDRAAGRVTQVAYDLGGYVTRSQAWMQDGLKRTSLELSIPAYQFDNLRRRLLEIGALNADRELNEVTNPEDARNRSTFVTVRLRQAGFAIGGDGGWNPIRTFSSAFNVVGAIFHVVADVAIWVLVVGGPFILIGLFVRYVVRRSRKSAPPPV